MGWAARNPQVGTNIGSAIGAFMAGMQNLGNQNQAEADRRELAGALAEYQQAAGAQGLDPGAFAVGLSRLYGERGLEPDKAAEFALKAHSDAWTRKEAERNAAKWADAIPDLFGEPDETDYLLRGGSMLVPSRRVMDVGPRPSGFETSAGDPVNANLRPVQMQTGTEDAPSGWTEAQDVVPLTATARAVDRYTADAAANQRYGQGFAGLVRSRAISPEKVLDFAKALEGDRTKDESAALLAEGRDLAGQNRIATGLMNDERARDLADLKAEQVRTQLNQRLDELGRRLEAAQKLAEYKGESAESVAKIRAEAVAEAAKIRNEAAAELARMRADVTLEAARIRASATEEAARIRGTTGGIGRTFKSERDLRADFEKAPEVKDYREIRNRYTSMEQALARATTAGNRAMADQALITLFNKLTDPNSVVRESEYARTAEYLPWVNKIQGKLESLKRGGPGLTDQDRQEIAQVGRLFMDSATRLYDERATEFEGLAREYGLTPSNVVLRRKGGAPAPSTPAPGPGSRKPAPSSGVQRWEKGPDGRPRKVH